MSGTFSHNRVKKTATILSKHGFSKYKFQKPIFDLRLSKIIVFRKTDMKGGVIQPPAETKKIVLVFMKMGRAF